MEAKATEHWPDYDGEYEVSVDLGARRPWEVYAPDEAAALELIARINTPSERLPDGVYRDGDEFGLAAGYAVPDGWTRPGLSPTRVASAYCTRVRPCSSPKVEPVRLDQLRGRRLPGCEWEIRRIDMTGDGVWTAYGSVVSGPDVDDSMPARRFDVSDDLCVSVLAEDQP